MRRPVLCLLLLSAACEPKPMPPETSEAPAALSVTPPGAPVRPPGLEEQLARATAAIDPVATPPRTRHVRPDGRPLYANRLLFEGSPYLKQHAHNPVDWRPWGPEAFEAARTLGRPVFLSVGYATCHWCHVMEEESFEDAEIAAFLNKHFICIKVDREERPDVDAVYMEAVQALLGRGGWPMSVFLTPGQQPFFAGTYFPARDGDRGSSTPGFLTVIQSIHHEYATDPGKAIERGERLTRALTRRLTPPPVHGRLPGPEVLVPVGAHHLSRLDPEHGGRAGAPKFPSNMPVALLLRLSQTRGDPTLTAAATLTLDRMAAGGILDQLGGGIHRYSTDAIWRVPHFEKMLYDQALVSMAFLDGYVATGEARHARVVRGILDDTLASLRHPGGAFHSALDADSLRPDGRREEGWYYTWTPAELAAVRSPDDAELAARWFGVTETGSLDGRSVLHRATTLGALATRRGISPADLEQRLATSTAALLEARAQRPPPLLDDKVLTAWNGLAISAMARAGRTLDEPRYTRAATEAATFIWRKLRVDGRLRRVWTGTARETALLDDHAFLAAGLLDLFEATGDPTWLARALTLTDDIQAHFADPNLGGWFRTPHDGEPLLVREKPDHDGAIPSGTSVHLQNLLRLSTWTTTDTFRQQADAGLGALGPLLTRPHSPMTHALQALTWRHARVFEVVVVVPDGQDRSAAAAMQTAIRESGNLHLVSVVVDAANREAVQAHVPWVEGKEVRENTVTAYVCEGGTCQAPTTDPARVRALLTP